MSINNTPQNDEQVRMISAKINTLIIRGEELGEENNMLQPEKVIMRWSISYNLYKEEFMAAKKAKQIVMVDIANTVMSMKDLEKKIKAAAPEAQQVWINPTEGKAYYADPEGADAVIDLLQ